ncbi:Spy/CpxP family protein refolding chaperone [Streptomyces sp. LBL]|uniref:hypothetical protein n=1 Tax=Streptomyces sp. LBL TaxID=2940562 RepID=UPI00247645D2|nr:hypothetical protein [Streptomyces sp. LBL]MDH6623493.1 Spy/CpxP family protein refolding chaperone [Streptomyces sp. LBL]
MKSLKAAALVAGAMAVAAAAAAAAPAVAHDGTAAKDMGLAGVVKEVAGGPVRVQPTQPLSALGTDGKEALPSAHNAQRQSATQQTSFSLFGRGL